MAGLVVDLKKCTGCRFCEMACSALHEGVYNPRKAKIRVTRFGLPEQTVVLACRQCKKPSCAETCPVHALEPREGGGVVVSVQTCTGCGLCAEACPFGTIALHPVTAIPLICDLCEGDPECVKHCMPGALSY